MNSRELSRLIEAHLDNQLSAEEAGQLSTLLAKDPEARRIFWEHAAIHGLAQEATRLAWLGNATPQRVQQPRPVQWWRWAIPLSAAAVAMILALVWHFRVPHEQPATGVAVLSKTVGTVWAGGSHEAGSVLQPGEIQILSGAVLIEFYSGARVVLEAPATFRLKSSSEGHLVSGKISAHVPSQARGFKIGAPNMSVMDLGTEFGLTTTNPQSAEVHVFDGKVEVTAPNMASLPLTTGEAVRMVSGACSKLAANRKIFLGESELAEREAAMAQMRMNAWQAASLALSNDPATLLHYRFDDLPASARMVPNQLAGAPESTRGSIVGCTWSDGRWPGKHALQFRNEGDRVRLNMEQPLKKITFLAWMRIESLPRNLHSIVSSDLLQTGALRWELSQSSCLRLGIGRDLGNQYLDWEVVASEPVDNITGKWLLLATTFDGATVRHYVNGQPAGSGAAFCPPSLLIGTAALGNWNGQVSRHLPACVDELAILSRAMTPSEIMNLYDQGHP